MKATHKGHCQACGRLQMLPSDVLAQHGYKITHGFFSGVCVGSKALPFEVSCGEVKRYIARACTALVEVTERAAELRQPPTEPRAWVHNYESVILGQKWGKTAYRWRQVDIMTEDRNGHAVFSYVAPGVHGVTEKRHEMTNYGGIKTALVMAAKLNAERAQYVEDKEAANLRNYISWQQERVDNWKPGTLLPVDAKDKAGFAPAE